MFITLLTLFVKEESPISLVKSHIRVNVWQYLVITLDSCTYVSLISGGVGIYFAGLHWSFKNE